MQQILITGVVIAVLLSECHGHRNEIPLHANQQFEGNRLRNRDKEHDFNHVREHLDGVVEMKQDEPLTAEEQQFQYFKVHDYDNNNMLDGIELIAALTHFHKGEEPNSKPLRDDDLSHLVDTILKEDDHNNDGFIDYAEFMLSQR